MVSVVETFTSGQDKTIIAAGFVALHAESNTRRTGIGTKSPERTLHLLSPDAIPARIESTQAATGLELKGSGGSGTITYDSSTGQISFGTDQEGVDIVLGVDVLGVGVPSDHDFTAGAANQAVAIHNGVDEDFHVAIRAGSTSQQRAYFRWEDVDGSQQWLNGVNAGNAYILYDTDNLAHRLFIHSADGTGTADRTYVSSAGTAPIVLNGHADGGSGSGGLVLADGNAFTGDGERLLRLNTTEVSLRVPKVGANRGLMFDNNNTDSSSQEVRLRLRAHNRSNEMAILFAEATGANHLIDIGGNQGEGEAATQIRFYTGSGVTAGAGTVALTIESSGRSAFSGPAKDWSRTTAERDALSAQNGDRIYNTTTNKFQGYANGAWVDLH